MTHPLRYARVAWVKGKSLAFITGLHARGGWRATVDPRVLARPLPIWAASLLVVMLLVRPVIESEFSCAAPKRVAATRGNTPAGPAEIHRKRRMPAPSRPGPGPGVLVRGGAAGRSRRRGLPVRRNRPRPKHPADPPPIRPLEGGSRFRTTGSLSGADQGSGKGADQCCSADAKKEFLGLVHSLGSQFRASARLRSGSQCGRSGCDQPMVDREPIDFRASPWAGAMTLKFPAVE
jgi:hypothetical protein